MSSQPPSPPPPTLEPWPPNWVRTTAFFFGLALAAAEFIVDHSDNYGVYFIALLFSGLPLAAGADKLYDLAKGRSG